MLQLSNLQRMRIALGGSRGDIKTRQIQDERLIIQEIVSVSQQIEQYCNRLFEITSRTEYFDVEFQKKEFFPRALPITSITSLKEDSTGAFTGGESTLTEGTDFIQGVDARSIVLMVSRGWQWPRGLQLVYSGGLATSGTQSSFVVTASGGTPSSGNIYKGATSNAVGAFVSYTAGTTTLVVDNHYGIFQAGETLTEYDNDTDTQTATGVTATLDSITTQSLAESNPMLVRAAEYQIRYNWKHVNDFENVSTNKDSTQRGETAANAFPLRPEVINILRAYRRRM